MLITYFFHDDVNCFIVWSFQMKTQNLLTTTTITTKMIPTVTMVRIVFVFFRFSITQLGLDHALKYLFDTFKN